LGVNLAAGATHVLARVEAVSIPLLGNVTTDFTVLAFCLLAAVATGVVFGLAPALQVPTSALHDVLKDTARGSTAGKGRNWIRGALVVSEIAFACVLLVSAGLLVRSFLRVLQVNLGFRPEQAATVRVDPDARYSTQAQQNAYFDEVLRRVRDIPGVVAAGLTDALPLGRNRSWGAPAKGQVYPKGKFPNAFVRVVSDGYLKALGIALIDGRDISERDTPSGEPVIVINQTMARTLWPGRNAIGQLMRACGERRVVGVVGDVHHLALEQAAGMEMYLPMRQCQDMSSADLVVRSSLPPAELAASVRAALKPIVPNLPGKDFRILQQLVDKAVSPRRFVVLLLGGFAVFALILASLGIYGVVSYGVNQRTQEIGIRMALGASASHLQAGIIGQTLGLAAAGILIGAVASRVLARALGGLLFGVTASDPATFLAMPVVLALVAVAAGYLPARRASRIDPSVALRAD
jgi:predicted permease